MCGRYTVAKTPADLADYFDAEFDEGASGDLTLPTYNASPGQSLPVIIVDEGRVDEGRVDEGRLIRPAIWGIMRAGGERAARFLVNARSETVANRPAFRDSFRRRRCLVLADGFYEWQRVGDRKQPYRVVLGAGEPFAFAGVWESTVRGERRFVILTTEANRVTRPIHDRMPVILERRDHDLWLDHQQAETDVETLLLPHADLGMKAYAVDSDVNSSRNDTADLIRPENDPGGNAVRATKTPGQMRGLFD
jgi:putative SOS response-associated peptidase YedK